MAAVQQSSMGVWVNQVVPMTEQLTYICGIFHAHSVTLQRFCRHVPNVRHLSVRLWGTHFSPVTVKTHMKFGGSFRSIFYTLKIVPILLHRQGLGLWNIDTKPNCLVKIPAFIDCQHSTSRVTVSCSQSMSGLRITGSHWDGIFCFLNSFHGLYVLSLVRSWKPLAVGASGRIS